MLFYIVAFLIVILDQAIKISIDKFMHPGQSLSLLAHVVSLTYVRNTGAAFSLFVGFSPYLAAISIIISAAVIFFHYHLPAKSFLAQTALAFILGGSLGNLADRLLRSYVIDYIDVGFWPVFNLADSMINIGAAMIIFALFKGGGSRASADR
jgi:signal peptidase II